MAAGTYDPRKLLGITKLDVVRAQQFIGEILAVDPAAVAVPVVGGHAGVTILPLLSQVTWFSAALAVSAAEHSQHELLQAGQLAAHAHEPRPVAQPERAATIDACP